MSSIFVDIGKFLFKRASVTDALFFGENFFGPDVDTVSNQQNDSFNPRLEAEVLLGELLSVERVFFRIQSGYQLSFLQKCQFVFWLYKRSKKIPVAYIIGYKRWFGMKILVNKHTLIPRDETELLVEHIRTFNRNFVPNSFLDIGTGSGCIAFALRTIFDQSAFVAYTHKKQVTSLDITAIDLSCKALAVAKLNEKNSCKPHIFECPSSIKWVQSDLLDHVLPHSYFDLITANLPYVPTTISVTAEVSQEPSSAIFSGNDGLDHIRRLAHELRDKKISFHELWLEFLPQQQAAIKKIFSAYDVQFLTDVGGDIYFAVIIAHTQ